MRLMVHANKRGAIVGVWGWDHDKLRYVYANEGWVERGRDMMSQYGGKPESAPGSEWLTFVESRSSSQPAVDWWDAIDLPNDTPIEEWLNAVVVIE